MIEFTIIDKTPSDEVVHFLYQLLSERRFSISHAVLPTYEAHKEFVFDHPYHQWYLVEINHIKVGSLYLSQDNSVGLNLSQQYAVYTKEIISHFVNIFTPLPAQKSKTSKYFYFNVSPDNHFLIQVLKDLGFIVTQVSLTLKQDKD